MRGREKDGVPGERQTEGKTEPGEQEMEALGRLRGTGSYENDINRRCRKRAKEIDGVGKDRDGAG